MGEVYRARDTKLNRDVAIKVLPEAFAADADRLARFTREAHVLASLNHPNIAAIYGIESHALVMELVEGEDLSAHIARGPMPLADTLPIARQIADALERVWRDGGCDEESEWIAYESNLSGRFEIYLQQFPPTADRLQISVNGGDSAYWRGDGKELFFNAPDGHIMAVDMTPGPTPEPSAPHPVFRLPADVNNGRFVATPDGQRFLVPLEVQKPTPPVMTVTLNWLEVLKGSVSARKSP